MKKPIVSVVIPTYNRVNYIGEAIQSVIDQTFPDFEIIVVDDGSTDNTEELIHAFPDNRIHYLRQENSGSPVSPRNKGIQYASGEYIAFLDSDDLWLPDKLEKQIQFFNKNPSYPMVYCDSYLITETGTIMNQFSYLHKPFEGSIFKDLIKKNFIANLTVMVKRETVLHYECQDEKYIISHDFDLYLKIAHDFKIGYVSEPLVKLRIHSGSMTGNRSLMRRETREIVSHWRDKNSTDISDFCFKKILAYFFCMEAFDLLNGNKKNEARKHFKKAFKNYPFNFLYGLCYFFAIINDSLLLKAFNKIYKYRLYRSGKHIL